MNSFDLAKSWSDFLGFHIRAVVFFTFGIIAYKLSLGVEGAAIEQYFDIALLLLASAIFFIYSVVMLALIQAVIVDFFTSGYSTMLPKKYAFLQYLFSPHLRFFYRFQLQLPWYDLPPSKQR